MNASSARFLMQAVEDSEPESPVFEPACIAYVGPFGPDHYFCDPMTCLDGALATAYGIMEDDRSWSRYFEDDMS